MASPESEDHSNPSVVGSYFDFRKRQREHCIKWVPMLWTVSEATADFCFSGWTAV